MVGDAGQEVMVERWRAAVEGAGEWSSSHRVKRQTNRSEVSPGKKLFLERHK